jgi:hypothetical protein
MDLEAYMRAQQLTNKAMADRLMRAARDRGMTLEAPISDRSVQKWRRKLRYPRPEMLRLIYAATHGMVDANAMAGLTETA